MSLFVAPRGGFWSAAIPNWDCLIQATHAGLLDAGPAQEPFPDLLPPRESRRAPLYIRLALEAAAQACRGNQFALDQAASVFASTMGDAETTDYMCRTVAAAAPMLSPTRFHNSVHNAASGYWSIAAGNTFPSTAVAAGIHTFSAALLEAALLATQEDCPVLLVVHDIAVTGPLADVCNLQQGFAGALLLSSRQEAPAWKPVSIEYTAVATPWPQPQLVVLASLARENDSAKGLALFEALARPDRPCQLQLPLGVGCSLKWSA